MGKVIFLNATLSKFIRETFKLIGRDYLCKILIMILKKDSFKNLHPIYAIKSNLFSLFQAHLQEIFDVSRYF